MNKSILVFIVPLLLICQSAVHGQSREDDETETLEATTKPADGSVNPSEAVDIIVKKTNEFRTKNGRSNTELNRSLTKAAQYFAGYMARTDRYGHRADGKRPSERAKEYGYDYCLVAENIAYQYNSAGFASQELANRFVEGWKNSPPHRENMLDPDVLDTGVAVARSETSGHWYAVQMYGRPKSAAIDFKIANRSDSPVDYTIKNRTFQLPPGYTRTHGRCRLASIDFNFGKSEKVQPKSGAHYTIIDSAGELELKTESSGTQ